jgi:5'-methylthioadenosine nucleosidase|tara:strand:+ start:625 stop:1317 length:693 start_codon:yes stop_codon:yes gene_type:complete
MEAEAKPLIEKLKLTGDTSFFPPNTPFVCHRSEAVTVVCAGKDSATSVDNVGTVPASLMTYLALQRDEFDLVINAGTCGGFKSMGATIGGVFITTASANHDRRIEIPGTQFKEYGIGAIDSIATPNLTKLLKAKNGVCTTGNSLDHCKEDDEIMANNNASCKDMEAAAIASICKMCDVPHFGVKVVTDIVDGDRPPFEEFMENLGSAAQSLQATLPAVLDFVQGKTIEEL